MYDLLKKLCDIVGPSGFEQDVLRSILEEVKDTADEWKVDALGNLIVTRKGTNPEYPSLLLAAHTDEVGFVVKKIENNGLIRFEKVGGHDDRILLSQPVKIKTNKSIIRGVTGTLSAHYVKWDDPNRVNSHRELYIDIGVDSVEEAAELGIKPGLPISYGTELNYLAEGSNRVSGKSLDDRAGCAVMIQLLKTLNANDEHGDIHFAFTVQEEVGLRGASVVANEVNPDFALAIDTTPTSDTGDVLMTNTRKLGQGPCLKVMDKSQIAHPLITGLLEDLAANYEIPLQPEVFMGIGTDAGAIHMTGSGIVTGGISIPSRYTHAPLEVVDLKDLENTVELTRQFIFSLNSIKGKTFLDT
ncbi:M42 family metallopeptidase [Pseudalkalibacillus caeni]|uniref:M42 family metallopeptidase n=1 Tax=Exobacillus caeni TaxID=2574798 RepID=A0A5R9EZV7_9BACL|nr:M42 family metallopeptidase [Pseudalkalibacillus caeni]TLS36777.1 M42 family metallopeptidase [Pseudalkalibacillus caeni]